MAKAGGLRRPTAQNRLDSGAIGRNDVCVHFKTDEKPVNQGICFYNYTLDTFYFSPRRSRGDEPIETIICDIERENPHYNYQEISFYVTGKMINAKRK